ncbi:unnamed protein product, partial [Ectocarpus fasciculatus]
MTMASLTNRHELFGSRRRTLGQIIDTTACSTIQNDCCCCRNSALITMNRPFFGLRTALLTALDCCCSISDIIIDHHTLFDSSTSTNSNTATTIMCSALRNGSINSNTTIADSPNNVLRCALSILLRRFFSFRCCCAIRHCRRARAISTVHAISTVVFRTPRLRRIFSSRTRRFRRRSNRPHRRIRDRDGDVRQIVVGTNGGWCSCRCSCRRPRLRLHLRLENGAGRGPGWDDEPDLWWFRRPFRVAPPRTFSFRCLESVFQGSAL